MGKTESKQIVPEGAVIVDSYDTLERYIQAFARGYMNLLIIIGSPGLSKSRTVRAVLSDKASWIEGNATAFGLYCQLYYARDGFVVIDDVDSLYADRNGVRLLKCLCQTEEEKSIAWHSATRALEKAGIPREYKTKSRVIIICNDWKTLNRNVAALQDRGHVLVFQPTASDIHAKAAEWLQDAEILSWFAVNLQRILEPSLRLYLRAVELKRAGMDWTKCLPLTPENRRRRLILELKAEKSHVCEEGRVHEFTKRGGGCRATYFNYKRKLGLTTRHSP